MDDPFANVSVPQYSPVHQPDSLAVSTDPRTEILVEPTCSVNPASIEAGKDASKPASIKFPLTKGKQGRLASYPDTSEKQEIFRKAYAEIPFDKVCEMYGAKSQTLRNWATEFRAKRGKQFYAGLIGTGNEGEYIKPKNTGVCVRPQRRVYG